MSSDTGFDDFHAIIPAGGTGTRLWPLSRRDRPKFLYDLLGQGRTLIQSTYDRLEAIAGKGNVYVSTGVGHVGAVREQLPQLDADNIFAEPIPRDSTAAIVLAAAVIARPVRSPPRAPRPRSVTFIRVVRWRPTFRTHLRRGWWNGSWKNRMPRPRRPICRPASTVGMPVCS